MVDCFVVQLHDLSPQAPSKALALAAAPAGGHKKGQQQPAQPHSKPSFGGPLNLPQPHLLTSPEKTNFFLTNIHNTPHHRPPGPCQCSWPTNHNTPDHSFPSLYTYLSTQLSCHRCQAATCAGKVQGKPAIHCTRDLARRIGAGRIQPTSGPSQPKNH